MVKNQKLLKILEKNFSLREEDLNTKIEMYFLNLYLKKIIFSLGILEIT